MKTQWGVGFTDIRTGKYEIFSPMSERDAKERARVLRNSDYARDVVADHSNLLWGGKYKRNPTNMYYFRNSAGYVSSYFGTLTAAKEAASAYGKRMGTITRVYLDKGGGKVRLTKRNPTTTLHTGFYKPGAKCPHCAKRYMTLAAYKRHMLTHPRRNPAMFGRSILEQRRAPLFTLAAAKKAVTAGKRANAVKHGAPTQAQRYHVKFRAGGKHQSVLAHSKAEADSIAKELRKFGGAAGASVNIVAANPGRVKGRVSPNEMFWYHEGAVAKKDGIPRSANPYRAKSKAHKAWSAGWASYMRNVK